MQVFQLTKQLQCMDPNAEVHFSHNYGDHWRTKVAPKVGAIFGLILATVGFSGIARILNTGISKIKSESAEMAK